VGAAFARISALKPGAVPLARMHGEVALSTPFTRLPGLAVLTCPASLPASPPVGSTTSPSPGSETDRSHDPEEPR